MLKYKCLVLDHDDTVVRSTPEIHFPVFKNTLFKKDEEPFIIELPEYKLPEFKSLMLHTWEKGKGFLKKAGTLIFSISVLVWFLSNFNMSGMAEINLRFLFH